MLNITFYGVRGSTPCSCDGTRGVGGNTACVLVSLADEDPIIFDLGTGLRYLGQRLAKELGERAFRGTALLTHLHWDHVQGLPFFAPLLRPGSKLTLVGPKQSESTLQEAFQMFVRPPLFPVELELLPGSVEYVETSRDVLRVGSATITVAKVLHAGDTNGYRIQNGTGSVAYLSDHQQPIDGSLDVPQSVIDLCKDVDLLIHDAQYNTEEFVKKATWGHSTIDYAVAVAKATGARRLALFHHDPSHDDAWVAEATQYAQELAGSQIEVIAAVEGLSLRSGSDAAI